MVFILGVAASGYWWMSRPQVIIFSDNARLTLVKVDYGKRHTPPVPNKTSAGVRAAASQDSFNTSNDALVLWVHAQYAPQQNRSFSFYLSDKAGTSCAVAYTRNWSNNGNEVVAVLFDTRPRRQGIFYMRVQEQGNGQEISDKKFVIANPGRGQSYATWTAEPLPSTKKDDDVSVTLTKLVAGADLPYHANQDDPDDAMNKGVQVAFHIERAGKPVTTWAPVWVETADATGNRVSVNFGNGAPVQWKDSEGTFTYPYGLWPDELAWKLKLEFTQQSGFADNELWTVKNIPLQPGRQQDLYEFNNNTRNTDTNAPVAETDLNGVHLKIFPAREFTDVPPNSPPQGDFTIQASPALPNGMRMTTVSLTDDQSNDVSYFAQGTFQNNNLTGYRYALRDVSGVTNLNLTIALHRNWFVEFTVKPEKP